MSIYDRDWYRERNNNEQKSSSEFSSTEHGNQDKNRGFNMKHSYSIIPVLIVAYAIAVGYNVVTVQGNMNEDFLNKNGISLALDVVSRLGLGQTLEIVGNALTNPNAASSLWQDERVLRELVNVLYDRYAPIKFSPVLGVSKEVGWFLVKNRTRTTNNSNNPGSSSSSSYAYVNTDGLNVRSGPSASNTVVTTLSRNTRVQVISKTGSWWKIKYGNIEGYVYSEYLRTN